MEENEEAKAETVSVTIPPRILRDLRSLTDAGIYLSVDEALREAIVTSWRFLRGSYHNIRIDGPLAEEDEKSSDAADDPQPDEPGDGDRPTRD